MIAIIPARGGSTRIPRKNIKLFHGEPIIAYSINVAKSVCSQTWVSTDDGEIAEIAVRLGARVMYRPEALAVNEVGTQDVMKHALDWLGATGIAFCIYPCAPMLRHSTLYAASNPLRDGKLDYVVPVATWLRDPGQFYAGNADAFRCGRPLLGPRTAILPIDPETECDINTPEDWTKAEVMFKHQRAA